MEKKELNKEQYYLEGVQFARQMISKMFKPFTCEDIKDEFHKTISEPNEPRIWGNIFNKLNNEKRIVFHSYQKCRSAKGHGHPSTVWISKQYSDQQRMNRKSVSKNQIDLFSNGETNNDTNSNN